MKAEDPKLVAIARALFENRDVIDLAPRRDEVAEHNFTPMGGPENHHKLVGFRHHAWSAYEDDEREAHPIDFGTILRHPHEEPENFYQRAIKQAKGFGPDWYEPYVPHETLKAFATEHDASEIGGEMAVSTGDPDYHAHHVSHMFEPIMRS